MRKPKTGSTLNGKPITITDSWDKMTFAQYLRILKLKDDTVELISILSSLDYDTVKKANISGMDNMLYMASFINTPPVFDYENVTHIGPHKLPLNSKGVFDIQFESLPQFEDMRQVFTKLEKGVYAHTEAYATYCAIYAQKLRDGEYDGDKALAMVPEVMTYPASHIITAGSFFFVKLTSLLNGTQANSQNTAPHRRKPIGKRSKRSSARTPRLTKRRGR